MQELDAGRGAEGQAQGVVGGREAAVGAVGLVFVGAAGGSSGGGEAFGDAAGGFGAADGGVGPDAVDFEEAAKGPDDGGEEVDGGGDGEETAGDDGVALGFAFGAEHAVDEFGADLGFAAAD